MGGPVAVMTIAIGVVLALTVPLLSMARGLSTVAIGLYGVIADDDAPRLARPIAGVLLLATCIAMDVLCVTAECLIALVKDNDNDDDDDNNPLIPIQAAG